MSGGRGIVIQGDAIGSPLITGDGNIIQGITLLPSDYEARLRSFVLEYIGTPEHPVPLRRA